jgi:chemotaxis protein MotB
MGTGCAISEVMRVNQSLKADNERLLMENRDLRSRTERADRAAQDAQLTIQDLRRQLARAELREGKGEAPAEDESGVAKAAFQDIGEIEVEEGREGIRVILPNKVFFEPGSVAVSKKGQAILDAVAGVLKREYAASRIRVDGHTDSTPVNRVKEKYPTNWELSTSRACAVVRYLVDRGLETDRIFAAGFSKFRPVASNATASGQQQNRRVEIVILRS